MEIEASFQKKKDYYNFVLDFIDAEDDNSSNNAFDTFVKKIDNEILLNREDKIDAIHLISSIVNNHHRTASFFTRIERILNYLIKNSEDQISGSEIVDLFINDKLMLRLLFEQGTIIPDLSIQDKIFKLKDSNDFEFIHFLYPTIKPFIGKEKVESIETKIKEKYQMDIETYIKKCEIGENDSYICTLIQHDSVDDFISHVNRTNLSLNSTVNKSIFETNPFLVNANPTLIEYAAFYGSIQIIQYLVNNKVNFPSDLWLYAIHSNNGEIIHFLEENKIEPENYIECFLESIKCHHNEIANYLLENKIEENIEPIEDLFDFISDIRNYQFLPDIKEIFSDPSTTIYGSILPILTESFTTITLPSSLDSIGNNSFDSCISLKKISISSSVKYIGENAFFKCYNLADVSFEIPSSLNLIGLSAFALCSLVKIIIPSSVTEIGDYSFSYCSNLQEVSFEIPSSLKSIGDNVFNGCSSIIKISIPSSVRKIGAETFKDCTQLKEVLFESPSSLESIGVHIFNNCFSLKEISIPSSLKTIGVYAFKDCNKLEKVSFEIPSSLLSIGYDAFGGCPSLTQIKIPYTEMHFNNNIFS